MDKEEKGKFVLDIFLFSLFFISILAMSAQSIDWKQVNHDTTNSAFIQFSLSDDIPVNTLNLSVQSADYLPASYDFTGDGHPEIVVYDSGFIDIYSGSDHSIISQTDGRNLISSPYIFIVSDLDATKRIIGFNTTDVLVWNVNSNGVISFSNSVGIPAIYVDAVGTYANYYPKSSVNCYSFFNDSFCSFKANNTEIVLFNFTSSDFSNQISVKNTTNAKFYTINNYKPSLYPSSGLESFGVFPCTQSARYGIALINMTSGATYLENCTIGAQPLRGNVHVFSTSGSVYDFFFEEDISTNIYIHRINSLLKERANYPLSTGSAGLLDPFGLTYNGHYLYECLSSAPNSFQLKKWSINSPSPSLVQTNGFSHNFGGGNPASGIAAFSGSDFAYCANSIYYESLNQSRNFDQTGAASPCFHSIYSGEEFIQSCTDGTLRLYDVQNAPLAYPNATLFFRNNISNTSLGVTDFYVYTSSGAEYLFGTTMNDGSVYAGGLLNVTEWNITFSKQGYLPFSQRFNITNGTRDYFFYAIPNGTGTNIHMSIFNSKTGNLITDANISINAYFYNTTSALWQKVGFAVNTLNGTNDYLNAPASNYSFLLMPNSGYSSGAFGDMFENSGHYILSGDVDIELDLVPIINLSAIRPRVVDLNYKTRTYLLNNVSFVSGIGTQYVVENGSVYLYDVKDSFNSPEVCVNQTVYLNATSIKQDSETYIIRVFVDNSTSTVMEHFSLPIISDGIVQENIFTLRDFDVAGNYSIVAVPYSVSFPFSAQFYPGSPFVVSKTIIARACAGVTFAPDGNAVIVDDAGKIEQDKDNSLLAFFSGNTFIENLMWYLGLWLIIGMILGAALTAATGEAMSFLYALGIIGFFDTVFFTWIYPLLGGFILFSAIVVIIFILTLKAKSRVSE